jgi:pilus assembly protein Flp/PilA
MLRSPTTGRGFFWLSSTSLSGANMSKLQNFLREEDGAAAIEYGLLAGLIAVAIITTVGLIGSNLNRVFGYISTALIGVTAP